MRRRSLRTQPESGVLSPFRFQALRYPWLLTIDRRTSGIKGNFSLYTYLRRGKEARLLISGRDVRHPHSWQLHTTQYPIRGLCCRTRISRAPSQSWISGTSHGCGTSLGSLSQTEHFSPGTPSGLAHSPQSISILAFADIWALSISQRPNCLYFASSPWIVRILSCRGLFVPLRS